MINKKLQKCCKRDEAKQNVSAQQHRRLKRQNNARIPAVYTRGFRQAGVHGRPHNCSPGVGRGLDARIVPAGHGAAEAVEHRPKVCAEEKTMAKRSYAHTHGNEPNWRAIADSPWESCPWPSRTTLQRLCAFAHPSVFDGPHKQREIHDLAGSHCSVAANVEKVARDIQRRLLLFLERLHGPTYGNA